MDNQIVNLSVNEFGVTPIVHVVQGDTGRGLTCNIVDYDIPSGATAGFYAMKPSKKYIQKDAAISGNTVDIELDNQTLAEIGMTAAQVRVTGTDGNVKSFPFFLSVSPSLAADFPASENESTIFDDFMKDAQAELNAAILQSTTATSAANTAASSANTAAAAANNAVEALEGALEGTVINDSQSSTITTYSSQHIDDNFIGTQVANGARITAIYLAPDGSGLIAKTSDGRHFNVAATTDTTLSFLVAKTS